MKNSKFDLFILLVCMAMPMAILGEPIPLAAQTQQTTATSTMMEEETSSSPVVHSSSSSTTDAASNGVVETVKEEIIYVIRDIDKFVQSINDNFNNFREVHEMV